MKKRDLYTTNFQSAIANPQLQKVGSKALYLSDNRKTLSPFQLRFNNLPIADATAKKALLLLKKPITSNNQDTPTNS